MCTKSLFTYIRLYILTKNNIVFYIYILYFIILIIYNLANYLDFSFLEDYYIYMSGFEGGSNDIPGEGNLDSGGNNSNSGGNNPKSESQVVESSSQNKYQRLANVLEENRAKILEFRNNQGIKSKATDFSDLGVNFIRRNLGNPDAETIRDVFPWADGHTNVDDYIINKIRSFRPS